MTLLGPNWHICDIQGQINVWLEPIFTTSSPLCGLIPKKINHTIADAIAPIPESSA
jgi:hypothetical protein